MSGEREELWPFQMLAEEQIGRARAALAAGQRWQCLYWTRSAAFWVGCAGRRRLRQLGRAAPTP